MKVSTPHPTQTLLASASALSAAGAVVIVETACSFPGYIVAPCAFLALLAATTLMIKHRQPGIYISSIIVANLLAFSLSIFIAIRYFFDGYRSMPAVYVSEALGYIVFMYLGVWAAQTARNFLVDRL